MPISSSEIRLTVVKQGKVAAVRILTILTAFVITSLTTYAQDRCGFDQQRKAIEIVAPGSTTKFESWMKTRIQERSLRNLSREKTLATYNIPIVVHVINNGEAVGTGTNISDAQIQSQIDVLNKDYQRLNADASNTPAEFAPVAGSISLQFVLAKQDPEGLPTSGIVRVNGGKSGWVYADLPTVKSLSYWPAEEYLNIWIINFTDTFLGVAQFPSTTLPGVDPPFDRLTDGVVIDYQVFGSADAGSFNLLSKYNKGRTATHEIGHFLGLLHIFGDKSGCSATDYVDDTPTQSSETLTCPTNPVASCGHNKMFQNYMDYTDDACMNLFTAGQISRIVTVLENSPRRISLLSSHGLQNPVTYTLDAESRRVVAPASTTCGKSIVPALEIRNRGTQTVTSVKASFLVNGVLKETRTFTVNIAQLGLQTVSFSPVNLPEPSNNSVSFQIVEVNGVTDSNTANDLVAASSTVQSVINAPIIEPFNSTPSTWTVLNPDNGITWQNVVAPKSTSSNRAMYVDMYDYEAVGLKDQLVSAYFTLAAGSTPILKFDRAYARFPNNNTETLRVLVSSGCSTDISQAVEVYKKTGTQLATVADQSTSFVPNGESQWATDVISLTPYAGSTVRIIFETTNGNGNNLYVDNLLVNTGQINDVAIVNMVTPGAVVCTNTPATRLAVQNLGTDLVTKLNVTTTVNGVVSASQSFTGLSLSAGALAELSLQNLSLKEGTNSVSFSITNPDAPADDFPSNNILATTNRYTTQKDIIPLRLNFLNDIKNWDLYAPAGQLAWSMATTNYNNSLVYKSFSNNTLGSKSWLVSPKLDLTSKTQGALFFTTSYASNGSKEDQLQLLASTDCGVHYDKILYDKKGSVLANQAQTTEWTPDAATDWTTEYVSMHELTGKDNVLLAFVATNANGNNIWLDNIELYEEDDPTPPVIEDFYSIYSSPTNPYDIKLTFNLTERQDAYLVVYNTLGQVLMSTDLPETLNQTYIVNLYGQAAGIYIAHLKVGTQTGVAKLFVGR